MNKKRIVYTPQGGVCSKMMMVEAEDGFITDVQVVGGCHGNSQGIIALLKGMKVNDAITRMEGINCHGRGTSFRISYLEL